MASNVILGRESFASPKQKRIVNGCGFSLYPQVKVVSVLVRMQMKDAHAMRSSPSLFVMIMLLCDVPFN